MSQDDHWHPTIGELAKTLFLLAVVTTAAVLAGLYTGQPDPQCRGVDHGVVALELSSTVDQVQLLLERCDVDQLKSAIVRDTFAFVPAYVLALVVWCLAGARAVRRDRSQEVTRRLGWAAVVAGVFDLAENALMWITLSSEEGVSEMIAVLTAGFAMAKFALLVAVGLLVAWVATTLLGRLAVSVIRVLVPPRKLNPLSGPMVDRGAEDQEHNSRQPDLEPYQQRYRSPAGRWPHETSGREAVGIAFSGGGVRSASFCQGVLQALRADEAERGDHSLIRRASYLSSVSGGGYTAGAFQQSLHALEPDHQPPAFAQGSPEATYVRDNIRHLWREPDRPRVRSLSGEPGTTPWNFAVLVSTGVLQVVFNILLLGTIVFVAARPVGWAAAYVADPTRLGPAEQLPNAASLLGLVLSALVGGWALRPFTGTTRPRHWLVIVLLALGVVAWTRFGWLATNILFVIATGAGSLVLFWGTLRLKRRLEARQQLAGWREWLPLPSTALAIWAGLAAGGWAWQARSEMLEGGVNTPTPVAGLVVAGWFVLAALLAIAVVAIVRHHRQTRLPAKIAGALVAAVIAMATVTLSWIAGTGGEVNGLRLWSIMAAALVAAYFVVEQRVWSPHRLYKERLASTFAVYRSVGGAAGRLDYDLATPLEEWARPEPGYPELIVSCAVNIGNAGPDDPSLPRRNAQEFSFGHQWVGGPDIGWARTSEFVQTLSPNTEDANLQAAIAISGAAVSTAMGTNRTFEGWEAWLALLNLRLGVWMPHPVYVRELGAASSDPDRIGPWVRRRRYTYLLKELLRLHDSSDRYVNVSDGGHLDNTGLLELIKRGCDEIWFFDGTGGGSLDRLEIGALQTTLRIASEDYQISGVSTEELEAKMADVISESGRPRTSIVSIDFQYPDGVGPDSGQGIIHIARCSLAQDSPAWVDDVVRDHSDFPYQGTLNQFFRHDEYCAYVRLGREHTERLLGSG